MVVIVVPPEGKIIGEEIEIGVVVVVRGVGSMLWSCG